MSQDWKKVLLTSLTVAMIWGGQTVNAADQTETTSEQNIFKDQLSIRSTSLQAVKDAVEQGLISGYPDGSFHPQQYLTRKEMAVLLAKASKLPLDTSGTHGNADWATPYINAVRQAGWMSGDANGNFRANDPIRREELAAIMVRVTGTQKLQGGQLPAVADESSVSGWAKEQVQIAVKLGLLELRDGKMEPHAPVERQDIAGMLIDVYQTGERTATLTAFDGKIAYIDGRAFVIGKELQELMNEGNERALRDAVITYNARTRNLSSISGIEIVETGTANHPVTFDTKGASFDGSVSVAGDHVVLKGSNWSQVILKQGAQSVSIDGNVNEMKVDTTDKVTIQGSGTWKRIIFGNTESSVHLPESIKTDRVDYPAGGSLSQVIRNAEAATVGQAGSAASSGSFDSSSSTPSPSPDPVTPIVPPIVPPAPVNQSPVVREVIADKQTIKDGEAEEVDLGTVFSDADHDELGYEAEVLDTSVANAIVQGSMLTIQPLAAGQTTVTVKAKDGRGGEISTSFKYTVTMDLPPVPPVTPPEPPVIPPIEPPVVENHAPTVANEIDPVTVQWGEANKTVDLSGAFEDEDGDELTYTAISSNEQIAEAELQGHLLTLTPHDPGMTTVTVSAEDPNGGEVSLQFDVTVEDPDAGKGLFISEVVWGGTEPPDRAIELYNPTTKTIEGSDISILIDGIDDPIQIDQDIRITPGGTLVIADGASMFVNDEDFYYAMVTFGEGNQELKVSLVYKGEVIDTARMAAEQSLIRSGDTVQGMKLDYVSSQWKDIGKNEFGNLGKFEAADTPEAP